MADKRKVLKPFRDGQDRNRPYGANGSFPRSGFNPSDERFDELVELGFIEEGKKVFDENNTNDELRAELDARGIEYNTSDNKKELLAKVNDENGSR